MSMSIRLVFLFVLAAAGGAARAEPAPWYWWVSQLDGTRVCNQTSLGEGWTQEPTPFRDARCRIPRDRRQ